MGMIEEDRRSLRSGGNPGVSIELLTATIPNTSHITGMSRSEIYRRLAAGDIRAVKNGGRTLILMDSVRDYLAGLPAATFRAPATEARPAV